MYERRTLIRRSFGFPSYYLVILVFALLLLPICLNNRIATAQGNITTPTTTTPVPESTSFLTYVNRSHGIIIQYPSNWEKIEGYPANHITFVIFRSPKDSPSDRFQESLGISMIPSEPPPPTLAQITDAHLDSLRQTSDVNIIDTGSIDLAGNPAHGVQYAIIKGDMKLIEMQVWTVNGNNIYLISYVADATSFKNYLPIIERMLKSVQM